MNEALYSQLMGVITRIQNYPGVEGIDTVESKLHTICEQFNTPLPYTYSLFLKGYRFDRQNQLDNAIKTYQECITLLEESDVALSTYIFSLIASIHTEKSEYYLSYKCYEQVLKHIHVVDDNVMSLIYCNISDMYLNLEKFSEAAKYAQFGIAAARSAGRRSDVAIASLNLGYSQSQLGLHELAENAIHQAKTIGVELQHNRITGLANAYLGRVMAHQKSQPKALVIEAFEEGEVYLSLFNSGVNRLENLVYFAEYLESVGEIERAQYLCSHIATNFDLTNHYKLFSIYAYTTERLLRLSGSTEKLIELQTCHLRAADNALSSIEKQQNDLVLQNIDSLYDSRHNDVLTQMNEYMGALTDIGQFIATAPDLDDALVEILKKINMILPTYEFGIALYDSDTEQLNYRYYVDTNGPVVPITINCKSDKSLGSYVVEHKTTIHLNTINDDVLSSFVNIEHRKEHDAVVLDQSVQVHSLILAPILLEDKVLGLLSVQHQQANQYHQYHRHLIEHLASFIAVSLENQQQRKKLEDVNNALEYISATDPLTGLYNRYQLDKIAPNLMVKAARCDLPISILVLDLDDYKAYNDLHGHLEGDEALRTLSQLMRETFSDGTDNLFRYGGDEFLVVSHSQPVERIERKIETLRRNLHRAAMMNPASKYSDRLTLSIGGVFASTIHECSMKAFDTLFAVADKHLYEVKEMGRNHYKLGETSNA